MDDIFDDLALKKSKHDLVERALAKGALMVIKQAATIAINGTPCANPLNDVIRAALDRMVDEDYYLKKGNENTTR